MGKITYLSEMRPYIAGEAFCLDCKHKWAVVAEVGATWLECPVCGLFRGRVKYQCERDCPHWTCKCGNDLFHVTEDGFYCPNCGAWQYGF